MDDPRQLKLPLFFFGLLTLVILSRIEATRDIVARGISVVLPLVTVGRGVAPFRDSDGLIRPGALGSAAVCAIASEISVGGALTSQHFSAPVLHLLVVTLIATAVAAIALEGLQARGGLRTRFAGWTGIAVVFGIYMPYVYRPENAFGTVLGGFFLSLIVGGGIGVLSGAAAVTVFRGA